MDPNVTLAEMRTALEHGDLGLAAFMADSLDRWLSSGGALPDSWLANHRCTAQDRRDARKRMSE